MSTANGTNCNQTQKDIPTQRRRTYHSGTSLGMCPSLSIDGIAEAPASLATKSKFTFFSLFIRQSLVLDIGYAARKEAAKVSKGRFGWRI